MTLSQGDLVVRDHGVVAPRSDFPKYREFTAEYKARILAEYDAAQERGARGALLRREGLYSSHISQWRRAAEAGRTGGLKPKRPDRRDKEIAALRARAQKAESELARTRAALDLVGKAHALLETLSESADSNGK